MAILIKTLAANTIAGTATLYTVPAAKSAVVNNIRLVNAGTVTTPALNLNVKPSGSSFSWRIHKKNFMISNVQPDATVVIKDVVTLGQGDAITLDAAAALTLAYM